MPLATAKHAFIETLGSFGVDYANGSYDRAVADTFPASDPVSVIQPPPSAQDKHETRNG